MQISYTTWLCHNGCVGMHGPQQLCHLSPGNEGNIDAIAKVIEANPEFARQLDYSARPGTKTYPR